MRKFPRQPVSSHAFLAGESSQHRILIQDFSRMGLGFVTEELILPKSFISLLYQNETNQIVAMKSYVKHVRKLKACLWYIGVQFVAIEAKK